MNEKAKLGKTYIPSQSRSWQYLMVFRHRNWISRLTTFGNQWNRRNNWTSGQNQRETIETSETIKTIEWWTSAYLRRQTKEVEIINRWGPIIHSNSSSSCTETRRIQILENRNDHTVIVQFSDISILKFSDSASPNDSFKSWICKIVIRRANKIACKCELFSSN